MSLSDNRKPKLLMEQGMEVRIRKERPKTWWRNQVGKDIEKLGITNWGRKINDRGKWRKISK